MFSYLRFGIMVFLLFISVQSAHSGLSLLLASKIGAPSIDVIFLGLTLSKHIPVANIPLFAIGFFVFCFITASTAFTFGRKHVESTPKIKNK